jgi:hypothetical protein
MLFVIATTWQIHFLPIIPSSESCTCYQPYQIVSRSMKTNHCPHLSISPCAITFQLDCNYQSMLRNIPEERRSLQI